MSAKLLLLSAVCRLANGVPNASPQAGSSCVIVNIGTPGQYVTSTSSLQYGSQGYTSTLGSSIVIGSPSAAPPAIVTSISTLSPGASSYYSTFTSSGTPIVVQGSPAPYQSTTSTTLLPAGQNAYSSYVTSGSYILAIIGQTQPYRTLTSSLQYGSQGYTSTTGSNVIIGSPAVAAAATTVSTSTLSPGASAYASTFTSSGTILIVTGSPAAYQTQTSTTLLPAGQSAYSSFSTLSGSDVQEIIGQTQPYVTVTSTSTLPIGATGYTSTNFGASTITVVQGRPLPQSTTTVTSYIDGSSAPYTSTVPAQGSTSGTVIVGSPIGTYTTTRYLTRTNNTVTIRTVTSTASGNSSGVVYDDFKASTTTLTAYGPTGTTVVQTQVNTTPGTVQIIYPTPATTCSNAGMQWAIYTTGVPTNNDGSIYANFQPTTFKPVRPFATGTVSAIGPLNNPSTSNTQISVYNSPSFQSNGWALDHKGYLFASQSGNYTFQAQNPDDIVMVWLGTNAYSGWNNNTGNWILRSCYGNGETTATQSLDQGQYYPLRVLFANAQGAYALKFNVTAPDGTQFISQTGATSLFLVQNSCDNTTAPAFPAWGQET